MPEDPWLREALKGIKAGVAGVTEDVRAVQADIKEIRRELRETRASFDKRLDSLKDAHCFPNEQRLTLLESSASDFKALAPKVASLQSSFTTTKTAILAVLGLLGLGGLAKVASLLYQLFNGG